VENMTLAVNGDILTITVDLSKSCGPSKSGKSITIASSRGNVQVEGTEAKLGLNIYRPRS